MRSLCIFPASAKESVMRLNEAIGANDCRLRGDGKLVDPGYFRTALALIAIVEADGRWRAEVVSTQDDASWH